MAARPILHLIAGVNGAGKTSFYRYHLKQTTPGAEFVNADELAHAMWPGSEDEHAREAAHLAARRREELLDALQTFVAETVFSHESKLQIVEGAQRRGFHVILYHVGVSSAALARARIATRVHAGGHDVPEGRIEARFERSLRLIPRAAASADLTLVFDNSGARGGAAGRTHTHVMTLEHGRVTRLAADVPVWVERAYAAAISAYRQES